VREILSVVGIALPTTPALMVTLVPFTAVMVVPLANREAVLASEIVDPMSAVVITPAANCNVVAPTAAVLPTCKVVRFVPQVRYRSSKATTVAWAAPPVSVLAPQATPVAEEEVAMPFPADPATFAVTVTAPALAEAVTDVEAVERPIAVAMLLATWVVVRPPLVEKCVASVVPSAPAVKAEPTQVKPLSVLAKLIEFPAVPRLFAASPMVYGPVPFRVAVTNVVELALITFAMFVPRTAALTPAAPDQTGKNVVPPFTASEPLVVIVTDGVLVPLELAVNPVLPTVAAVMSTFGLVLPVTVTPAEVPVTKELHLQVVVELPFMPPVPMAEASQETIWAFVPV
jgi:hypothetical protein